MVEMQINYYYSLERPFCTLSEIKYYSCKEKFFLVVLLMQFQFLLKVGEEKDTFTNPSTSLALHKTTCYRLKTDPSVILD